MKPYKLCPDGFGNYDVIDRQTGRNYGIVRKRTEHSWHAEGCIITFSTRRAAAARLWRERFEDLKT